MPVLFVTFAAENTRELRVECVGRGQGGDGVVLVCTALCFCSDAIDVPAVLDAAARLPGLQGGGVSPPVSQRLLPGGAPLPERGHLRGTVGAVRVRYRTGRLERRGRLHSRHVRVLRAACCKIPAKTGIWGWRSSS